MPERRGQVWTSAAAILVTGAVSLAAQDASVPLTESIGPGQVAYVRDATAGGDAVVLGPARRAPASKIVFTGVGDWLDGPRKAHGALFRVDIEDRSEPLSAAGRFHAVVSSDYRLLNAGPVNSAPVEPAIQRKAGMLSFVSEGITIARNTPQSPRLLWTVRSLEHALLDLTRGRLANIRNGSAFVRTSRGTGLRLEGSQPNAPATSDDPLIPRVKLFFVDLGRSSGPSITMTVVNEGSRPVVILGDGFALEPVARMSEQDVRRELAKLAGKRSVTVTLDWSCLQMKKAPPTAGMVMRLAPADVQATMGPVHRVAAAIGALSDRRELTPDSDPEQYRQALIQWALWTDEQRFDERTFTQAFIDHSRKNLEGAGRKWTRPIEDAIRSLAPGRWAAIQRVYQEAQLPLPGGRH